MFERESFYHMLPSESMDVCEENRKEFFYTLLERNYIWKKRFVDKQERPWTDNKIFQDYKFTNVYRELDRSSQWLINNIIRDESLDLKNLVWKILVYRIFNNPETFKLSVWPNGIPAYDDYNEDEFYEFIKFVRSKGQNPYTSAYIYPSMKGHTKDEGYCKFVVPEIHKKLPEFMQLVETANTPEQIFEYLKNIPLIGKFTAHEFYQDLCYIPIYTDKTFMKFGQNDFTNVGPGSGTGIRLIYPSLQYKKYKTGIQRLKDECEEEVKKIAEEMGVRPLYIGWNKETKQYEISENCNITLNQIEMWLCEYQKYWKMVKKVGKQRQVYVQKTF